MPAKTYHLTDANPGQVTVHGKTYTFVAFYFDGNDLPWDTHYGTPYFGNFYKCDFDLTIDGITASFHNGEAAYQSTKWWHDDNSRKQFEQCKSGKDAFDLKNDLYDDGVPENRCRLGYRDAMFEVCKAKFSIPEFQAKLLATGDAYLLEHNPKVGRDKRWSDNNIGDGENWLGLELMKVRAHFKGSGEPGTSPTDYEVKDFTNQVKKDVPGS